VSDPLVVGSLFSGYGGLDLGIRRVVPKSRMAWCSDIEKGPRLVLAHRFPNAPNLGDVTKIDWAGVEPVDLLAGGFPCQDVSLAGTKAGLKQGTMSGLWISMAQAVEILRPALVLIENVRGLLSGRAANDRDMELCEGCVGDDPNRPLRAAGAVLGDLARLGYDAQWHVVRASDAGAPHRRERVYILAADAESGGRGVRLAQDLWEAAREGHPSGDPAGLHPAGGAGRQNPGVKLLPTPQAHDAKGAKTPEQIAAMRAKVAGVSNLNESVLELTDWRDRDGCWAWGPHQGIVHVWEQALGRPAPRPLEPNQSGTGVRLSRWADEWMMGLSDGWITAVPGLSWSAVVRMCGNGVVPQQAELAVRTLLPVACEF